MYGNLRDFASRIERYRTAPELERLEAVAVLTTRVSRVSHPGFATVLGAGVAAIAAYVGVLGTYALFLQQSAVAVGRDAQARADALTDAGHTEQAVEALKAIKSVGEVLNSGTDIVFALGGVVAAAAVVGWLVIHENAHSGATAQAWLTAFARVDAELTPSNNDPTYDRHRKPWTHWRPRRSRDD
ncbi:hypothetical protein ACIQUC_09970 [Curtobacterium sp. NPDC098951]|uniref:hypothetical protein n=1 Tax=Curtobacterium sp. NPDC098951 TaxID=3363974 RepID=UPI0038018C26